MSTSQSNELSLNSSTWGNAWVCKIMNQSSNSITFVNPYKNDKKGEIAAGKQESSDTTGYIPLSGTGKVYEISYYNANLRRWSNVGITDLNRDWMLSFKQAGVVDEVEAQPASGNTANITLIINDAGYQFAGCGYGDIVQSSLAMRRRH